MPRYLLASLVIGGLASLSLAKPTVAARAPRPARTIAVTVFGTGGTDNPALANATSFDGDVDGDGVSTVTFVRPFSGRPHVVLSIHGEGSPFMAHQLHVKDVTASQVVVLISEAGQYGFFSEDYELIAMGE